MSAQASRVFHMRHAISARLVDFCGHKPFVAAVLQADATRRHRSSDQSYRRWNPDKHDPTVGPTSETSYAWPPQSLPESKTRRWKDIDTSFVDVLEVHDFPTALDPAPARSQQLPRDGEDNFAEAAGGGAPNALPLGEAAEALRSLCEKYITLDPAEHRDFDILRDRNAGPNYERFDFHMLPRRTWLTARSRFADWRAALFRRDAVRSGAVSPAELFDLLDWFASAQDRATSFIERRGFDNRSNEEFLPLDLTREVSFIVAALSEAAAAATGGGASAVAAALFGDTRSAQDREDDQFGATHFGLERLASLFAMCHRFDVPFTLDAPAGGGAVERGTACLLRAFAALRLPTDDSGGASGTPRQALPLMACARRTGGRTGAFPLRFSDATTGEVTDPERLSGAARVCALANRGRLENFDADDMADILAFYVQLGEENATYFARAEKEAREGVAKNGQAAAGQPQVLLPLNLHIALAVHRVRSIVYNRSTDRNVYSDTDFVPLRQAQQTSPTFHKDVVPDRAYHTVFGAEGTRRALLTVRAAGALLEVLPKLRGFSSSEFGPLSVDTLLKDLLAHVAAKPMCNNASGNVMRPADALRLLRSLCAQRAERGERPFREHGGKGASSLRTAALPRTVDVQARIDQTLALVDMNISVNAAHIVDPAIIVGFFEGFGFFGLAPSSLPKLETAALRLLSHPSMGIEQVATMAAALAAFASAKGVSSTGGGHGFSVLTEHLAAKAQRCLATEASAPVGAPDADDTDGTHPQGEANAVERDATFIGAGLTVAEALSELLPTHAATAVAVLFVESVLLPHCFRKGGAASSTELLLLPRAAALVRSLLFRLGAAVATTNDGEAGTGVDAALSNRLRSLLASVVGAALSVGGSGAGEATRGRHTLDEWLELVHAAAAAVGTTGDAADILNTQPPGEETAVAKMGGAVRISAVLTAAAARYREAREHRDTITTNSGRVVLSLEEAVRTAASLNALRAFAPSVANPAHSGDADDVSNVGALLAGALATVRDGFEESRTAVLRDIAAATVTAKGRGPPPTLVDHGVLTDAAVAFLLVATASRSNSGGDTARVAAVDAAAGSAAGYVACVVLLQERLLAARLESLASENSAPGQERSFSLTDLRKREVLERFAAFAARIRDAVANAGVSDAAEAAFAAAEDELAGLEPQPAASDLGSVSA